MTVGSRGRTVAVVEDHIESIRRRLGFAVHRRRGRRSVILETVAQVFAIICHCDRVSLGIVHFSTRAAVQAAPERTPVALVVVGVRNVHDRSITILRCR